MSSEYAPSRFSIFTDERPPLEQFVLLSLMLHVLAVVLFGDTTDGGARRGEKLWGALTVTVQRLLPQNGNDGKPDRSAPPPQTLARQPQPAPASPENPSQNRDARAAPATSVESPSSVADVAPPTQSPTFEMPALISTEVEKAVTEFVVPKPSVDRVFAPPSTIAEPTPRAAPAALPSVPLPVIKAPDALPAASTVVERALLSPLPIVIPAEPVPRKEPAIVPATLADLPAPVVEREIAKPVVVAPAPKPREIVPPIVPPVVQPAVPAALAPLKPEREITQTIPPPLEPRARELPALAISPPAQIAPPARAEVPTAPQLERETVKPTTSPEATAAAPTPTPTRAPSTASSGTPNADRDLQNARGATSAPSTESSATAPALGKAPGIDLDAVRKRAREINSGAGSRTLFAFPGTPPQKPKSREQQAFDKALKKNDCRDAYADMGLAAVVPLVLDSVREGGCKW